MIARVLVVLIGVLTAHIAAGESISGDRLLADVRAKYAALETYSDAGILVVESKPIGATTIREQLTFVTRFQASRRFYFDAKKQTGERFVIWCPDDTFHSWWSATQVHEAYGRGEGANAFAMGALPTFGSALLIPPLLFQSAGLQGALMTMQQPRYLGIEMLDNRRMHKLIGSVRENHWNDSVRETTLWVDAETLLVHKIFEDTPSGMGAAIQRTTTTLKPRLPPRFEADAFVFR